MSILSWIVLGLIAGFISSLIVDRHGSGVVLDIVIGTVGALLGGFVFKALGLGSVTGFNLYSIVVAVVGAVILLCIYHVVRRTSSTS
jgi:uncharacterized membrane protein YeaQ/YmgE (transglycosylase-associated protein family)